MPRRGHDAGKRLLRVDARPGEPGLPDRWDVDPDRERRADRGAEAGDLGPSKARTPFNPVRAELVRSEEHTSELQSLMRISYAVFCLKKTKQSITYSNLTHTLSYMT